MFRTAALAGVIALALGPSSDQSRRPVNLEAADCTRINQMFGDYEVARAEQHATVSAGGTLEIRPDSNGGVRIERGSAGAYQITACIAAGARNAADAIASASPARIARATSAAGACS